MDSPEDEAQRRAELLVSDWHKHYRLFVGSGSGLDWQAKKALIQAVAAAIAQPLGEVARLKEDAVPARPARRAKED